jgi:anti-sigma28 factor (negative regulator of flagellin synthesis)
MENYPEMMIQFDSYFKNKIEDGHLSLNAHKIIADTIINNIKNNL